MQSKKIVPNADAIGTIFFAKYKLYSSVAKYRSASSAAIQPVPAAVIA